jgi:predicted nucleotidyltransferase component of viral defense system
MGKIQILTKEQQVILDLVKNNEFFRSNFYFTGGTALSAFYLKHRYSDDLDFFSQERFDQQIILTLIQEWSQKYKFSIKSSRFAEVVYVFMLQFNNEILKVDFGYYPYKRVEKSLMLDGIKIDSLLDIAVNKLLTISQRYSVKDFVDLYFLLQKFSIWDLIEGVRIKFKVELEPLLLGADFLKIEEFDYLPRMTAPLTLIELKEFFRQQAKEIGRKSVE